MCRSVIRMVTHPFLKPANEEGINTMFRGNMNGKGKGKGKIGEENRSILTSIL